MLFKLTTSSCKSDMSESLKIILIEFNIIKVNIIKIYTKNITAQKNEVFC